MAVIDRMRRIGADLASLAGMRVELFGVELRELFDRWLSAVVLALVTVAFWDSHPLVALGVFVLLFLGAAAWCARRLSAVIADSPAPFEATLAEFRKDREAITPRGPRPSDGPRTSAGDATR